MPLAHTCQLLFVLLSILFIGLYFPLSTHHCDQTFSLPTPANKCLRTDASTCAATAGSPPPPPPPPPGGLEALPAAGPAVEIVTRVTTIEYHLRSRWQFRFYYSFIPAIVHSLDSERQRSATCRAVGMLTPTSDTSTRWRGRVRGVPRWRRYCSQTPGR